MGGLRVYDDMSVVRPARTLEINFCIPVPATTPRQVQLSRISSLHGYDDGCLQADVRGSSGEGLATDAVKGACQEQRAFGEFAPSATKQCQLQANNIRESSRTKRSRSPSSRQRCSIRCRYTGLLISAASKHLVSEKLIQQIRSDHTPKPFLAFHLMLGKLISL